MLFFDLLPPFLVVARRRAALFSAALLLAPILTFSLLTFSLLTFSLLTVSSVQAQIIEEELIEEEELGDVELTAGALLDRQDEIEAAFAAAVAAFEAAEDPARVIEDFEALTEALETWRLQGELSEELRPLLPRVLAYRARLHAALGDAAAAADDLVRVLELEPAARLPNDVPASLERRFDQLRRELVGELRITAEPPDLKLRIDGQEIPLERPPEALPETPGGAPPGGTPPGGTPGSSPEALAAAEPPVTVVPLFAGVRLLSAERPGYAPLVQEIEVEAGEQTPLHLELERTSAVIRLVTRPSGAEVRLDGEVYGTTAGTAPPGLLPPGAEARFGREEFSAVFEAPDVELGLRLLEIHKEGFRPYRVELPVREAVDYEMPPIVLEEERSYIALRDLPAGAEILLDGEPVELENPGSSRPRLEVLPGEHFLQVASGPTRMFSTRLRLADRQTVEVQVRLRPGLAFLGVLGGEHDRAAGLEQSLRLAFERSSKWSWLDRRDAAPAVLAAAGFTVEKARRAAAGDGTAVDWPRLQRAADDAAPGLVYVLAVLSDDLLTPEADVFVWSAAPGPARPDHLRIDLAQSAEVERLSQLFHRGVTLRRPWLGGLAVTTDAAPHPVVAEVTTGGPLAAAGVRIGEALAAVAGVPVFSGADVAARVEAAETGETVEVEVLGLDGASRVVRVSLGTSPWIHVQPDPDVLDAIAYTELRLLREPGGAGGEEWVATLNQALIAMRAFDWERAVRLLRDAEAPENPRGVGRAAADYWLGVALEHVGADYRAAAIAAFERAAAVPGARLDHHDGAYVAPRARARLAALGAVNGGASGSSSGSRLY